MSRRFSRVLVLALGMLAMTCAGSRPKPVDFSERRRDYRPEDYPQVLKTWTRHQKVWRDVGTVIELWAAYKSWDFRQAYLEKYGAIYNIPEGERAALHGAQLDAVRRMYEFHVAAQTTSTAWNDLEKEGSPWRVSLVDGTGAELEPSSIEAITKLPELYEAEFFPFRTEFSRTYLIRFDRAEAERAGFAGVKSGRIILRMASPLGRAELVWESS